MTVYGAARLAVLMGACALAGCGEGQRHGAAVAAPTVTVANPVHRTVVDEDEYVGRFVAVDNVEVRSRLSGYLAAIHFTDGQMVKKGDPLFTIDRRPYQIALDQARANLAQARARLAFAQGDLGRGKALLANSTITEQVYDQRVQAENVAVAAVAAQQAAVNSAALDLDQYTELRAPIDGRIGDRRVSVGNLVTGGTGNNTTLLATIVSVNPIRFEFTFDEAAFLRYQRFAMKNKNEASLDASIPVALKLLDETKFDHKGRMDFVDNVISNSSGTIRARAVFANPAGLFVPGMFGRIRVPGSEPYNALLVPDTAIGSDQTRKYVLVVDHDDIVRQKYVTLGQLDGALRIIKSGLTASDRVVVDGIMHAHPGGKVTVERRSAPQPATDPSEAKAE